MLPIRVILHPMDFADESLPAFRMASLLARDYGARLILLHVTPPTVSSDVAPVAADSLAGWAEEKFRELDVAGLSVQYVLKDGDPIEQILGLARSTLTDMIVMATHGRTGVSRLMLGSVAEEVVRQAPCPVLMVRTIAPAPVSESSAEVTASEPALVS